MSDPIHKRKYHAFLSHAHEDKDFSDSLFTWLESAGLDIWYNKARIEGGAGILSSIAEDIPKCRAMILVFSEATPSSKWVKEEYAAAFQQSNEFDDFQIIPLRLDETPIPDQWSFLKNRLWLTPVGGKLGLDTASMLLHRLNQADVKHDMSSSRDIFVSRTWRANDEAPLADHVCRLLDKKGFRLIGDSKDQAGFGQGDRVDSIISSCGALAAILPDRGDGTTSKYMCREIESARNLNLPTFIIAEDTVKFSENMSEHTGLSRDVIDKLSAAARRLSRTSYEEEAGEPAFQSGLEDLNEDWKRPPRPHRVFFGTDFSKERKDTNKAVKNLVEAVTKMPCIMGEDIREQSIRMVIHDEITKAFMMLADISRGNLNTCIEAGIAWGADIPFHLLMRREADVERPWMFRDQQIFYYEHSVDLLGQVNRVVLPYRRRVLDRELSSRC